MSSVRRAGFGDLDFIIDLEWREDFRDSLVRWKRSRHHVGLLDEDMRYLIFEDREGAPRGFAVLAGLTGEHGAVEVRRIIVDRPGEGLGSGFLAAIKTLAFGELGANRLWVDLFEGNERAMKAYQAAGFVVEGTLRDAIRDGEQFRSLIVMSILARENEAGKPADSEGGKMTDELFHEDAYLKSCDATVTHVSDGTVTLDRTVFYPEGGGQPGDTGKLVDADGREYAVVDTVKGHKSVHHVLQEGGASPRVGDKVTAEIDWDRRYRHMRMHTALHLLCSQIPFPVTGGQIGAAKGRLDFDMDEGIDKETVTAELNRLVGEDHPVTPRWVSDEELDGNPDLVRTMSVQPPRGSGRVRLLEVEGVDLQACGGTHVARTGEIGAIRVGKVENKGRRNRRVNILFAD